MKTPKYKPGDLVRIKKSYEKHTIYSQWVGHIARIVKVSEDSYSHKYKLYCKGMYYDGLTYYEGELTLIKSAK
jgi:hypothetical protein